MTIGATITTTLITIIGTLILFFLGIILRKISALDENMNTVWRRVDDKVSKDICEEHRAHQTSINMETIKELAGINTKLNLILNGGCKKPQNI